MSVLMAKWQLSASEAAGSDTVSKIAKGDWPLSAFTGAWALLSVDHLYC